MWKCERCGASVPRDCRCGEGDATPPAIPERTEIARLRAQLAEAQQQRDQILALLDRLVMTTRELESARPFDEWVDARAKRTEAINAAERVLAALAKEIPHGE